MEREAAATSSGDNIIGYQHERSNGDQRQQGAIHPGEAADTNPPPNTTIFLHDIVKHQRRLTSAKEPCRNPLTRSIRCLLPKAPKGDSTIDHSPTKPGQHQKAFPIAVAINSFTIKLQRRQQCHLPGQFRQAAGSQEPLSSLAYILLNQSSSHPSTTHPPQPLKKASLPPAPWSPHQCVPMLKWYPVISCSPNAIFKSLGLHLHSRFVIVQLVFMSS